MSSGISLNSDLGITPSDLDPILKDTLLKMEENLSLEISKRIESLNNLTKELSNEISANGEININLILQELDKVNEDIERIKEGSKAMSNELKAVSSNINRINDIGNINCIWLRFIHIININNNL